jgi:hypothetical protein
VLLQTGCSRVDFRSSQNMRGQLRTE